MIRDFGQPGAIWQLAVLVGTLLLAWFAARWLRGRIDARRRRAGQVAGTGAESLDRALFPLVGGLFVLVAQAVGERFFSTVTLQLALMPLFGIALIYLLFSIARRAFVRNGRDRDTHAWLSIGEKLIPVVVWIAMVPTVPGIERDVVDCRLARRRAVPCR